MPFGDHVQCDVRIMGPGSVNSFTCRLWYILGGSSPQPGTYDTYVNEMMEHFVTAWAGVIPTGHFVAGIHTRWQVDTEEHYITSSNASVEGTVSGGEVLPEECSVIFRRYTGQQERNRRGRIFLPFVPETFQNNGRINATGQTAYQALAADLKSQVAGDSIDGDGLILTPAHANFKQDTLHVISNWTIVVDVHTRRDRKLPKRSLSLGVP